MQKSSKSRTSNTKKKVISNVIWATTGKVTTLISALFVGILVARYLGPEQYGIMNYVISIVTLFTVFAQFGMDNIIIRELSKKDFPLNQILGTALKIRIVLAIITILIIAAYTLGFSEDKKTSYMIMIYSLSMIFQCFDVIKHYFTSIVENKEVVKSEIVRTIFSAGIKILLLLVDAPLIMFILALVLDFIVLSSGYLLAYKKKGLDMKEWGYNKEIAKYLLKNSFPLLISGGAVVIYQRIDQVMIANILDNKELGIFSTAASFVSVILFIPQILSSTISPILVRSHKENNEKYNKEAYKFISITTWCVILISLLIFFISYPLIRYTYGIEYIAGIPVLKILVFKSIAMCLSSTTGQLIIIENIQKYAAIRNIIACIVCIVSNSILIPKYGIIGSAWSAIITVVFQGWLANLFIPAYRDIFKMETKALGLGWLELFRLIRNK